MRMIAWLFTIMSGLGGLALREQGGIPFAFPVGAGLLALAALACPLLWARDGGLMCWTGVRGKDRLMLGLALVIGAPLILGWPA
jgi:hypothetical protein